ncbi:MAG TPA: hypothetical protein VGV13_08260 [Methylomirabilota bacterium]|nr:hypothetical protein [Methylomirabilota bacterium]
MTTHYAQSATSISGDLISHVESLHRTASEWTSRGPAGLAPLAIPAYIVAVAAVEAYLNETYSYYFRLPGEDEEVISADALEKLELGLKLILLPYLLFGKKLSKSQQPYQDMDLLIKLRNELVHYKMSGKPPKPVKSLAQRGIIKRVPPEQEQAGGPHAWADRISTLEGIRWANNTAAATVHALAALAPSDKAKAFTSLASNFRTIPLAARGK